MNDLDKLVGKLNKKFGSGTVVKASDVAGLDVKRVSTGSFALDIETGGGFPFGRIVELFGAEGSGKTALALKVASNVQKLGKEVVWFDAEGVFDKEWAQKCGVNLSALRYVRAEQGEKILDMVDLFIRSGNCGLVVVDSIAALIPTIDIDTSMSDPERLGQRAMMMNRSIRKIHSGLNVKSDDGKQNECLVLLVRSYQSSPFV